MLSTCTYILAMDTFGPITDNAGGITEMSGAPEEIRIITDRLDACGNTTKALTKGYAVGSAAQYVILEVRQQFKEIPGIMEGKSKPDYARCVDIVTKGALKEMILPGIIVIFTPIIVGILLEKEAAAGFLMITTTSGVIMALFLNNGGGAWDNAKKLIELGEYGGKNSEAHKASVVGDTVGDPFKDTAGPSLHVLIKLVSTLTLVLVALFS